MFVRKFAFAPCLALMLAACGGSGTPEPSPEPGATPDAAQSPDAGSERPLDCSERLIPGACNDDHDSDLETLASQYDRAFTAFGRAGFGLNSLTVIGDAGDRALMEQFIRDDDGWDFEAFAGKSVTDVVDLWIRSAGLYAGVAIAADAYRYGVMRDQGYPAAEVARARTHLVESLDAMHLAVEITGQPGAIARGTLRSDIPSVDHTTTPLFMDGQPQPPVKNNGTWRQDASGQYANYKWEDSCSRDMLLGWVTGFAAAWEIIRNDPAFDGALKTRLQDDARILGEGLRTVRASGFDLELIDGDGRTTFHGYLHEENIDGTYVPGVKNGGYAAMALGIVSALVYVSEDPQLRSYLLDELIAARDLPGIALNNMDGIDLGPKSNYSSYNMTFQGLWLALRYLPADTPNTARESLRGSLSGEVYDRSGGIAPQPLVWNYTLFDFMFAGGMANAKADSLPDGIVDQTAIDRGVATLRKFPVPPHWNTPVVNCDSLEEQIGVCTAIDGSTTIVLNPIDSRSDQPQALEALPFELLPRSNYRWRSSPLEVNSEGDGRQNMPAADFRYAYWLGRWVKK